MPRVDCHWQPYPWSVEGCKIYPWSIYGLIIIAKSLSGFNPDSRKPNLMFAMANQVLMVKNCNIVNWCPIYSLIVIFSVFFIAFLIRPVKFIPITQVEHDWTLAIFLNVKLISRSHHSLSYPVMVAMLILLKFSLTLLCFLVFCFYFSEIGSEQWSTSWVTLSGRLSCTNCPKRSWQKPTKMKQLQLTATNQNSPLRTKGPKNRCEQLKQPNKSTIEQINKRTANKDDQSSTANTRLKFDWWFRTSYEK